MTKTTGGGPAAKQERELELYRVDCSVPNCRITTREQFLRRQKCKESSATGTTIVARNDGQGHRAISAEGLRRS